MPLADNQAIHTLHFTNNENSHHCVTTMATLWPLADTVAGYLNVVKLCWTTVLAVGFPPPFLPANFSDRYSNTEISMVGRKGGLVYSGTTAGVGAGTGPFDPPTINVSEKIHKVTGIAGRKYRGVMLCPPMHLDEATDVDSGGFIDSVIQAQISGWFENARNQLATNTRNPILVHADATVATPITSLNCGVQVGTIRKRLRP